jgi:hypothetical protein
MHIDPNEEKAKVAEELASGPATGTEGQAEAIPETEGAGELID